MRTTLQTLWDWYQAENAFIDGIRFATAYMADALSGK